MHLNLIYLREINIEMIRIMLSVLLKSPHTHESTAFYLCTVRPLLQLDNKSVAFKHTVLGDGMK